VVVDLVIPEKSLVAVAPEEVLASDVLVRVLVALFERWHMLPMLPMFVPEIVCIDGGDDQERRYDVKGEFTPEITRLGSVFLHLLALLDEGVCFSLGLLEGRLSRSEAATADIADRQLTGGQGAIDDPGGEHCDGLCSMEEVRGKWSFSDELNGYPLFS